MASEKRQEFAKIRNKLIKETATKEFICARCGKVGSSVNIHHMEELWEGGENELDNLIPLCSTCHEEWDLYDAVGMDFGNFLVSLPVGIWVLLTASGVFRYPHHLSEVLRNSYKMQFASHALKFGDRSENGFIEYYNELKRQNAMFDSFPYSDHDKMLELYGGIFETIESAEDAILEINKNSEKIINKFRAS